MKNKTFPGLLPAGRWLIMGLLLACFWVAAAAAPTPADVQDLLKQGELEAALEAANAGLEEDADNIELSFLKGLVLTRLERFDAAEKVFQSLIEEHPKLPEPYNNLAVVYAAQGEYEKARETLLRAINTHPSYATAYENIGDIYAKMASDAYNQALQLNTENTAAREKLALVNDLFSADLPTAEAPASQPEAVARTARQSQPELQPAKPTAEMPGPVIRESEQTDGAERNQPASEQPESAAETQSTKEPDTRAIVQAVRDWAAAWSSQDVDAYLGAYADDFLPPADMSRQEWAAQRRERVGSPEFIEVSVDNIRVHTLDTDHVQARFSQDYSSDTYSDSVTKTLLMKRADGDDRWLIVEEHSE